MATALDIYNEKIKAIEENIQKIRKTNQIDNAKIAPLRKEYQAAINDIEVEKADSIESEILKIERISLLREEQIKKMKHEEYPERKRAKEEYIKGLEEEADQLIVEYSQQHEKVMEARNVFLHSAAKAEAISREFYRINEVKHNLKNNPGPMLAPMGLPATLESYEVDTHTIQAFATDKGFIEPVVLVQRMSSEAWKEDYDPTPKKIKRITKSLTDRVGTPVY